MATNQWHFSKDGQVKGPFDDEQLKALCEVGTVNAATYVWKPDYPDWKRLAESDFQYKSVVTPPSMAPRSAPQPNTSYHAASHNTAQARDYTASHTQDFTDYEVEDISLWGYYIRALTSYYVKFQGRARRKEYWGFVLFNTLAIFALLIFGAIVDTAVGNIGSNSRDEPIAIFAFIIIYYLGTLLPSLAILARRLHDINLTAWLMLLLIIPYLGGIIIFIMTVLSSYPGRNKHGPSPVKPFVQQRRHA